MNFLYTYLLVLFTKYSGLIFSLVTSIVLVRTLGVAGFGVYSVALLLSNVGGGLLNFGVGPAIIYSMNVQKNSLQQLFLPLLFFGLLAGSLYVFILAVFSGEISDILELGRYEEHKQLIFASSLLLPPILIRKQLIAYTRAIYEIKFLAWVQNILVPASTMILVVLGSLFLSKAEQFIFVQLLVDLGFSTLLFLKLLTKQKLTKIQMPNWIVLTQLASYSLKGYLGTILQKLNLDIIMLALVRLLSFEEIAVLSISIKMVGISRGPIDALLSGLVPKMSLLNADNLIKTVSKVSRVVTLFMLTMIPVFWFLLPFVVSVFFGKDFASSKWVIRILLPSMISISLCNILLASIAISGRPEHKTYARALGLVVSISGLFLIQDYLNLYQACALISAGYLIALIYTFVAFINLTGVNIWQIIKIKRCDLDEILAFVLDIKYRLKDRVTKK